MNYRCLLDESYKKSSTFLAGIWLFEINTTMSPIIITGFFWRYFDNFQRVNGRRCVVVRMFISYCFESGPESSSRSENFSLLKSGICLDAVQIANSSRILDGRFEYLRTNNGGPFWKQDPLRTFIGYPHWFNLHTEITARSKSKYSIFPETVTSF